MNAGRLALVLGLGVILCVGAFFAGIPAYWAPLVIGGGLGLLTALAPGRQDDRPKAPDPR
jgi:hypothetical protein